MKLIKDVCEPCTKFINIGQPLLECENCSRAVHTKCFKLAGFSCKNGLWLCCECSNTVEDRYCPFPQHNSKETDSDKFYDNDFINDPVVAKLASVLESCERLDQIQFNKSVKKLPVQPDSKKVLSSLFCNIDGNATNFDEYLVELKRIGHSFDVLGLAETNIEPNLQGLYQIPNYVSFYQEIQPGKKKGTGVAMYISDNLNSNILDTFSYCTPDIECIFVEITDAGGGKVVYGTTYRPPNGSLDIFCQTLENIARQLSGKRYFLLGDFNSNLLDIHTNSQIFEDTIFRNNLYPTISIATHMRPNCNKSCIDNILTSEIDSVLLSGVLSNRIGEHSLVFSFVSVDSSSSVSKEKQLRFYDYSNPKVKSFVEDLETNIDSLIPSTNFNTFVDYYSEKLDKHCKLNEPKLTKRTPKLNPWITDGIIASIDKKHELCKEWSDTVTNINRGGNQLLYKIFSDYRRMLKHIIKAAKRSYYCNEIYNNIENSKKTWEVINELRGKKKRRIKPPFIIDNERIMNRRAIANGFNSWFVSIAPKLNETLISNDLGLHILPLRSFYDFLSPKTEKSIMLEDCSPDEILRIIRDFENGKASDIPIKVIKKSAHVIAPILSKYYNFLMRAGLFPDILKTGKITPVYKKGDPEIIENYRPISTLSVFGKIFEKIIYTRLYKFVSSQGIISPTQFGFRQSHSTSHAVNYSVNLITKSLKDSKHVLGIFIDLSKAFDTIDHSTLLIKLEGYGIRGMANDLIKSYLTNRLQYTEVLGEKSDTLSIQFGVPQGSILGPLLFLLYMNDISNSSKLGSFVTFADDTNIFVVGRTKNEAYKNGNRLLNELQSYMRANKLHINKSKCCFIHFKPKTYKLKDLDPNESVLTIGNYPIKQVQHAKFLGVTIDENLNWEEHIKNLKRKLSYATSILCRLRCSLPELLHRQLYYTLFESHLSYCISVWGGAAKSRISSIFTAQKHCLRVLFGDRVAYLNKFKTCVRSRPYGEQNLDNKFFIKEHTKPLFREHGILALQNLYTYHVYLELYKIMKFRAPISLFDEYECSARKPTLIICQADPPDNYNLRSTKIWNVITPKLKFTDMTMSVSCLRSRLKVSLLNNQHNHTNLVWTNNDFDSRLLLFEKFEKFPQI